MNKKMRKALLFVLCLALVAGLSIGGTLAWLAAVSNEVENTFTVGNITIELDEAKVNSDNKEITGEGAERVDKNSYTIIPGETVAKDPTVTVQSGSEKCYVYVCITNSVALSDNTIVASYTANEGWTLVGEKTEGGVEKKVYRYNNVVDASSADVSVPEVISEVKIAGTVTESNMSEVENDTIVAKAYAHQSENTTQAVADAAAVTYFEVTASSTGA